ncbi:hypothetical protein N431DRAFT_435834 [Stipitochalara longipes BDJ]|nr:hypothetical protein N431DRAFT_435834 [Stipitochalara longipes BDJ]
MISALSFLFPLLILILVLYSSFRILQQGASLTCTPALPECPGGCIRVFVGPSLLDHLPF